MSFIDRKHAGNRLADALEHYRGEPAVVLALPRGGVPVAAEIAARLGAPLDLLLVRKIGVPYQPELAMGAVIDGTNPVIIRNEDVIAMAGIETAEFDAVCQRELKEIERRRSRYGAGHKPVNIAGKTAIIVDDGIATGATVRAAIKGLAQRQPKKIVLAVPVAPPEIVERLSHEVDEIICLEQPEFFGAIGMFYQDFRQTSDEEVIGLLAASDSAAAAESDMTG